MSDLIRRQLQQRIDSLRLAGVEFLPRSLVSVPNEPAQATTTAAKPTQPTPPVVKAPPSTPTQPSVGGLEPRSVELKLLTQRVAQCTRCPELAATRTQTVFGVGPLDAEICFIGEAPGADEDRKGEPFVGAAGQLLDRIIAGRWG